VQERTRSSTSKRKPWFDERTWTASTCLALICKLSISTLLSVCVTVQERPRSSTSIRKPWFDEQTWTASTRLAATVICKYQPYSLCMSLCRRDRGAVPQNRSPGLRSGLWPCEHRSLFPSPQHSCRRVGQPGGGFDQGGPPEQVCVCVCVFVLVCVYVCNCVCVCPCCRVCVIDGATKWRILIKADRLNRCVYVCVCVCCCVVDEATKWQIWLRWTAWTYVCMCGLVCVSVLLRCRWGSKVADLFKVDRLNRFVYVCMFACLCVCVAAL